MLLCVGSVAAGYYGASALVFRRVSQQADGALHVDARVLAVLDSPDKVDAVLDASACLLAASGGGRQRAIAVQAARYPALAAAAGCALWFGLHAGATEAGSEEPGRIDALRRRFETWRDRAGVAADWDAPRGDPAAVVATAGASSDLLVMERPVDADGARRRDEVHAAVFGTHRPVLLVPPNDVAASFDDTVAIAWTGDRPVKAAIRTALPLLRAAARVVVLSDDDQPPPPFAEHGIAFERATLEGDGSTGERILRAARAAGAGLLVMGAYRRGALPERLFGGVTRHLVEQADLALLVRH